MLLFTVGTGWEGTFQVDVVNAQCCGWAPYVSSSVMVNQVIQKET